MDARCEGIGLGREAGPVRVAARCVVKTSSTPMNMIAAMKSGLISGTPRTHSITAVQKQRIRVSSLRRPSASG